MLQAFSPIQNHILSKLKNATLLRYSELMPDEKIPNDLFNYHLQFLVKKEFVTKHEDGYSLSESGVRHVADPVSSQEYQKIVSLFKVNVITILSRIKDGEIQILNQIRNSHPSFGKVGVMGGIILKGEPMEIAATRKFKEETGLDATFKVLGIERRIMYVKDELFADVFFPISYSKEYEGDLNKDSEFGEHVWVPIDQAIQNESDPFDSISSITTVLQAIKEQKVDELPFFFLENTRKGDNRP